MLNLFLANVVTAISTILVLGVLTFSIITIIKKKRLIIGGAGWLYYLFWDYLYVYLLQSVTTIIYL